MNIQNIIERLQELRTRYVVAIVGILGAIIILLVIAFSSGTQEAPQPQEPLREKTITVSGVEINNVLETPLEKTSQGDSLFVKEATYQIAYLPSFNQFIINILSPSFEQARNDAEEAFMKKLGISKEEACRLNVSLGTPNYVNPELSGEKFPLSFCDDSHGE